eukprot:jgi/Mesen1/1791/ME000014S01202
MTSMNVPEPVMSLSITPSSKDTGGQFSKALNRFQKEDPTFRVSLDPESNQEPVVLRVSADSADLVAGFGK